MLAVGCDAVRIVTDQIDSKNSSTGNRAVHDAVDRSGTVVEAEVLGVVAGTENNFVAGMTAESSLGCSAGTAC